MRPPPRDLRARTRRGLAAVAAAALALALPWGGCDPESPPPAVRPLGEVAAGLDRDLRGIRDATVTLAAAAATALAAPPDSFDPPFPRRRYRTFEGALTYYQGGADESSAVWVGPAPIPPPVLAGLHRLEAVDRELRAVVTASPLVAMAWVAGADSAAVFFPPYDLVAYTPTDLDVPRDILPYRAAAPEANPGREPVWGEPYVDLTGKGFMVTVSAPVYLDAAMVAVAAADVPVAAVARRVLAGEGGERRLLLTAEGFLAGATEPAARALGIEAPGRHPYLRQMRRDAPAPERFNLLRHPTPAVRDLAARVLAGQRGFPLVLGDRQVRVASAAVPETGWSLVELERAP